ncbi:flavin reductase family protein [Nocardioides panaciterrulae]|uniref:3-hydroxy-9,10-secoandrosta-1,3,5(10)-triene-9, 17-dione monooxygenase reductase component n=1 Tax=Nocardioides panaciterrulae TaxID=661492 RepID=A0A7Y9E6D8_9ACTN|nr:flavin reductase family protein [Nocardioides panaciterrulae]NYD41701.1 3-hydroxy-9,10-secoandrosta-1,3,5(10)-triene-9,17-dione monooxygenase reductase component [Nocardioides panaciterrulae]
MASETGRSGPTWDQITDWMGDPGVDFELWPGETAEVHAGDQAGLTAARRFRDVLGRFASGVTVVTGSSDGRPVGLTCQSFSSVSLDPPLVLFVAAKTSRAWPLIQRSGHFCVNFLGADQARVSNVMASRGVDKFAAVGWAPSPATGSPVLDGVLGYVDCTIHAVHEAGDHHIVVGRVLDLGSAEATEPLLYYRGRYTTTEG